MLWKRISRIFVFFVKLNSREKSYYQFARIYFSQFLLSLDDLQTFLGKKYGHLHTSFFLFVFTYQETDIKLTLGANSVSKPLPCPILK